MPEISRFFGTIIRMYAEAGEQHHSPHFHAYYQDDVVIYGIDAVEALAGGLPRRQQRLVEAWAELHQDERAANWARLQDGRPPRNIEPFDEEQSMAHPIHRITSVEVTGTYRLRIGFDDGSSRNVDFEPILKGEIYGPLRDPELFAQVQVDPEVRTIVWPNGADFDPAILHDWPEHEEAMRGLARRWALASV